MNKTSLFLHLTPCFCSLLETSQGQDSASVWLSFGKNVRGIENLILWVQGPQWGKKVKKIGKSAEQGSEEGQGWCPPPPPVHVFFCCFTLFFVNKRHFLLLNYILSGHLVSRTTNVCFKCFIPYNFLVKQNYIQWSLSSGHQQRSRGSLGFTFCRN